MDSDREREKSSSANEASSSEDNTCHDSAEDSDDSSAPLVPQKPDELDNDTDYDDDDEEVDELNKLEERVESAEDSAVSVVEVAKGIKKNVEQYYPIKEAADLANESDCLIAQNKYSLNQVETMEAKQVQHVIEKSESNFAESAILPRVMAKRPSILEERCYDLGDIDSSKAGSECYFSAQDFLEYGALLTGDSRTPDIESGYYDRSESDISRDDIELARASKGSPHRQVKSLISSEGLRQELNRFRAMIDIMERERLNNNNMEQNLQHAVTSILCDEPLKKKVEIEHNKESIDLDVNNKRGYWSTVFGEASPIETAVELTLDERFSDIQKAHRALELLEDYHSRLLEPQDRALRIAIERVIRIFKSRLFQALLERDYMQAYRQQSQCIQSVVKMLQQLKEENWCLPIMYTTCLDLRILARKCEELGHRSTPGEILEKAAEGLLACFRVCAADNRAADEDTKRLGMLNLVNQLFKVYFRINKLHLCKPLIRAIESSAFRDTFPLPEQITYKYFVGRKAMFDSDYKSADEFLSFAFRHCPSNFSHNKRLILIYLVPVKMLLGYLPKKEILQLYDVLQFHELVLALKEGNVRKFDEVIRRHELWFIKCGIYLLVEKLKFIVYRNLFKRVYLLRQTHQLDMNDFHAALKFVGELDVCIDETHCIVANLIYEGKIKGYISHSHNKLVVSKQNPFPAISTVATSAV